MRRALAGTVCATTVVLTAAVVTPWQVNPPEAPTYEVSAPPPPTGPLLSPPALPAESSGINPLVQVILLGIVVALAVALLVVLGLMLWRRWRDRYVPRPHETPGQAGAGGAEGLASAVQDAAQRALAIVDEAGGVPRDAVVAAWLALEEAAAGHGAGRRPSDTPTEFTTGVLATTSAPSPDVAALRGLYQRARFTSRPVTDDDVAAARTALTNIARAIDPGPGAVPAASAPGSGAPAGPPDPGSTP